MQAGFAKAAAARSRPQSTRARTARLAPAPPAGVAALPHRGRRASRALTSAGGSDSAAENVAELWKTDTRPIILFDGVCNLCNGGVNFALDWDPAGRFRFAALQSRVGAALLRSYGRSPQDYSSIVLCERTRCYTRSEAVLRIGQGLQGALGFFPVASTFGLLAPSFVRDNVYDLVARNRYGFFGRSDACRLSSTGFEERFISDERL